MSSDVTINTALTQQSQTLSSSQSLASDFSSFLTLLTIQLQNQDPLSPMDSTEFTNQLVAFAGVEQQINTNQKLDSMVSLQLSNAMGSAIGYVGKNVSYLSSEFNFDGETPVEINYAYQGEPVEAMIRIENEEGDIVFETPADLDAGSNEFVWDGRGDDGELVPEGTYEIKIDALDIDGQPVESTTVVTGLVRGVETQNGIIFLLVGERAVALGTVINVSLFEEPGEGDGGGDDGGDDGGEEDA